MSLRCRMPFKKESCANSIIFLCPMFSLTKKSSKSARLSQRSMQKRRAENLLMKRICLLNWRLSIKQRSTSWRSLKILFLSDRSCCRSVSFLFRPWNMAQSSRRFLSGTATNIIPTMPMMKKSIWRTLRQEKLTAC